MVCSSVRVLAHAHNAKLSIQNTISQDLNDSSNYMEQHSTNNVTINFAVFPYDKETQNVKKNLAHKCIFQLSTLNPCEMQLNLI